VAETSTGSFLQQVQLATVAIRVADIDLAVGWYRDILGMEPIHRGSDGNTPPYAAYTVAGMIITVWQLADDQHRIAEENDRNSYVMFVYGGDIAALHARLVAAGVQTDVLRESVNNRFFWFHDLDHNRWEVSQPSTTEQRGAMEEVLKAT
jgi:catechol 2,3-dioxygenase-like lactoylglutathione lyase family enzyme